MTLDEQLTQFLEYFESSIQKVLKENDTEAFLKIANSPSRDVMAPELYNHLNAFVLQHFPDLGEKGVDNLLWNATAFPFVDMETLEGQIVTKAKQSGGDVLRAIKIFEYEMVAMEME